MIQLKPANIPYRPHTAFVAYVTLAGVVMLAMGLFRLLAPIPPARNPQSPASIRTLYSLMILLGAVLIGFAIHWRFFA